MKRQTLSLALLCIVCAGAAYAPAASAAPKPPQRLKVPQSRFALDLFERNAHRFGFLDDLLERLRDPKGTGPRFDGPPPDCPPDPPEWMRNRCPVGG